MMECSYKKPERFVHEGTIQYAKGFVVGGGNRTTGVMVTQEMAIQGERVILLMSVPCPAQGVILSGCAIKNSQPGSFAGYSWYRNTGSRFHCHAARVFRQSWKRGKKYFMYVFRPCTKEPSASTGA